MLKVVGASGIQSVISLSILIGYLLHKLAAPCYPRSPLRHCSNTIQTRYPTKEFVCFSVTLDDDQNFAATISWNPYTSSMDIHLWGQNNDPNEIRLGIARAYYQSSMPETGWAVLEIETSGHFDDTLQAYAAGILEGILTWKHIYWHWKNTVEQACVGREEFCQYVKTFLQNNTNYVRKRAAEYDRTNKFLHQVNLFYRQLDGIEYGWNYEVERNQESFEIDSTDFLWMNIMSDLRDFEQTSESVHRNVTHTASKTMSFLKMISKEKEKFLLAHASSGSYSSMLRIQKKYKFNYHTTGNKASSLVPGQTIIFTSYPASIHSQDDFYQVLLDDESSATVAGTTLNIRVPSKAVFQKDSILLGPRVMAANRLARIGKEWTNILSQYKGGTGNKQWLHVQNKDNEIKFWVLEQTPDITVSKNETVTLHKLGYWISSGLCHYEACKQRNEIIESNTGSRIQKILANGHENASDVQSLIKLMREPELAIIGRSDLYLIPGDQVNVSIASDNKVNLNSSSNLKYMHVNINAHSYLVKYNRTWYKTFNLKSVPTSASESQKETTGLKSRLEVLSSIGIIDLKIAEDGATFTAVAGPPYNIENKDKFVEPFQWSKSRLNYLPHHGHSDTWDFQPMTADFVWL